MAYGMVMSGWRVEIRDADLFTVGPCDVFTSMKIVLRHRKGGAWTMTLPADHPQAALLSEGAGILVWGPWSGERPMMSGPVVGLSTVTQDNGKGSELTVTGVDDTALLGDRLALPNPSAPMSEQGAGAYYTTSGAAEKVIRDLVDVNAGDAAVTTRRICDADPEDRRAAGLLVGATRSIQARFDNLLTLVSEIAATDNLGIELVQPTAATPDRHLRVWQPVDRSDYVRLSQYAGTLNTATATIAAPSATNVLVAGGGEGIDRVLVECVGGALTAVWARRIEVFRDARDTSDSEVLAQRGDETLAEAFMTAGVSLVPVDTPSQTYGTDYGLGDTVTVDVAGGSYIDVVSGVEVTLSPRDGAVVVPQVGDPDLADVKSPAVYRRVADLLRRIESLERRM